MESYLLYILNDCKKYFKTLMHICGMSDLFVLTFLWLGNCLFTSEENNTHKLLRKQGAVKSSKQPCAISITLSVSTSLQLTMPHIGFRMFVIRL